ncbi:metalloendoproteinase 3-MMP-like [Salvia miltiorrhiza]|uniref:metalloendoproteinase 3-MMP-like n=1 Tax=Salvia miltiorrhiza TaxID=226208 RepID=UPI0025AC1574|nr:metalloendoproteinase 3-MMP-like [Salvia miltiorrhiza]
MAIKRFYLILFVFLIFLLIGITAKRNTSSDKNPPPFDFITKLKGYQKGNNTKEVHDLKAYLERFGYLNKNEATNGDFDDALESAIKTYQKNFHIKPSGVIDDDTISKMRAPRCGVADIVNGTNYMQPRNKNHLPRPTSIHTVSHFSFFRGEPRWPPAKNHLTYRFSSDFAADLVARAFQRWESDTHFSFSRVGNNQEADIVIEFKQGYHGDGSPFDGPYGILAHSFAPTDGRLHFDADENWSAADIPSADAIHLESVAVHEIGHLLGLGHSAIEEAIMYPTIGSGEVKTNLQEDDIQGIAYLYNYQN